MNPLRQSFPFGNSPEQTGAKPENITGADRELTPVVALELWQTLHEAAQLVATAPSNQPTNEQESWHGQRAA